MKILETRRLLLRHMEMRDVDGLFALYRDPEMRRYFPDGVLTYEETREEVAWFLNGHPRHPELGLWATIHKESEQLIGRCGLLPWTLDGRFEVEVAYLIAKTHWGQGLGTEAALAVRDYGFAQLGLPRLVCFIDQDNVASIRVAEKIGMRFEREAEDELGPFWLYSQSRPAAAAGADASS